MCSKTLLLEWTLRNEHFGLNASEYENVENPPMADLVVMYMHLQICIFRPQGVLKSKSWRKQTQLKIQFYIEKHVGQLF